MKQRNVDDNQIRGKISEALALAIKKRNISPEVAAGELQVKPGTMYKYLAGAMIPGGHVLWRACHKFGMVLDEGGLRLSKSRKPSTRSVPEAQYDLPFINETIGGEKVRLNVRKKDSDYVQVNLKIKVAG